jgi:ribulose kinase
MSIILGIDFGTSGVRVGAFDLVRKEFVRIAEAGYPTSYPHPGWAEQQPEDWWSAFQQALNSLFSDPQCREADALTVVTTSSTVVIADEKGGPLRPAILWMDARAEAESAFTATISHPVLKFSGGSDAVEWLIPKAMWLSRHEPGTYHAADRIVEALDYINFRLTGCWVGSRLNATCKWNYNPIEERYYPELFAAFGIPEIQNKLPSPILPVGAPIGEVRVEVAAALGFTKRPLVVQGGIDAHTAMLGAGTTRPGDLLITGGTSVVHLTHSLTPPYIKGIWGPYPSALLDDHWLIEGGQVSGGSILTWLTDRIFGLDAPGHQALIQEAAKLDPCANGLLTLDYWMGNRTPYRDAKLRGSILGLSLFHDRISLYRSAVEAIALGTKNVLDTFETQGLSCDRIVVAGGIRSNPLWLEVIVDAIGKPVCLTHETNLSILAGAVAGSFALGHFPSLEQASTEIVSYSEVLEPDLKKHQCYTELLDLYRRATECLTPVLHELSSSCAVSRLPAL